MSEPHEELLRARVRDHLLPVPAVFRSGQTVTQALEQLRAHPPGDRIAYLYVCDGDGRLAGVVPTRRLLVARPEQRIGELMLEGIARIDAGETVRAAYELMLERRLLALPVVDRDQRLLGIVSAGAIASDLNASAALQEREDVFQLIGVHLAGARVISPLRGWADRFPWLLCNIAGGLACGALLSLNERLVSAAPVLVVFVPVVLALAESVSMQSMALVIDRLHGQTMNPATLVRLLAREVVSGALLGISGGGAVGLVAWAWHRDGAASAVVGGAIGLGIVGACLLGVVLPFAVRALRLDPKIAAGPVVLATADLLSLAMFLYLGSVVLGS